MSPPGPGRFSPGASHKAHPTPSARKRVRTLVHAIYLLSGSYLIFRYTPQGPSPAPDLRPPISPCIFSTIQTSPQLLWNQHNTKQGGGGVPVMVNYDRCDSTLVTRHSSLATRHCLRHANPRWSSWYLPLEMIWSVSIHTSQLRVRTSTCVFDFQFAWVWLP